jgi:hypothetical protein
MTQLRANFYFKHPDSSTHNELTKMFPAASSDNTDDIIDNTSFIKHFVAIADNINPTNGGELALSFLEQFEDHLYHTLSPQSAWNNSGYCVSRWVSGVDGDRIQMELLNFFYELCPNIHAQSWGRGNNAPWEYWLRYQRGKVIRCDDEPFEGEDDIILGTVYRWWHSDIPNTIKAGILNEKPYDVPDQRSESFSSCSVLDNEYNDWVKRLLENS